jgi:hypothetical protein
MTVIVSVETMLLVLLVVLVAGLLRSHAEILRRLGPADAELPGPVPTPATTGPVPTPATTGAVPTPAVARSGAPGREATAIAGSTPDGDPLQLSFAAERPILLAFLTSGCATCARFWHGLGERRLPAGVRIVVVTRGRDRERPSRLRSLATPGLPVVMSSEAWEHYRIPGAPYFVLVDNEVRGEGVATSWAAVASLVSDAIEDQRAIRTVDEDQRAVRTVDDDQRAVRTVDETLAAAGIGPDHPSLYPSRER